VSFSLHCLGHFIYSADPYAFLFTFMDEGGGRITQLDGLSIDPTEVVQVTGTDIPVTSGCGSTTVANAALLPTVPPVDDGDGLPPVGATSELDSLLLFGSGLSGLGGYAFVRLRARRRR
jgi:hypothetical protein